MSLVGNRYILQDPKVMIDLAMCVVGSFQGSL
jgi:hypothetical protein